ncbi:MAG TPA: hypothetical protein PKK60_02500 [archaeon]|nr:hypothetical protein [archaeon]
MVALDLIFFSIIDFVALLLVFSIIVFFVYKLFSSIRKKVAKKYDLSWTKSCLVVNFVSIFSFLLLVFIYFYILGGVLAKPIDPEIQYNLVDDFVIVLLASVRILVASIIASFLFLFFELITGFFMEVQLSKGKSNLFSQFYGILVACFVALILFLFVFNWAFLGFFIYVFYGSINSLPLMFIKIV